MLIVDHHLCVKEDTDVSYNLATKVPNMLRSK